MKKKISLVLAGLMLASSCTVSAAALDTTAYSYNKFSNAVIVNAGDSVQIDSAREIVELAEKNGADKVIITSAGKNTLSIALSDEVLDTLDKKDIPVKLSLAGADVLLGLDTIAQLSEKASASAEITLDSTAGIKATLRCDDTAATLTEPMIAVCTSSTSGINTVMANGSTLPTAEISGNVWYLPIKSDVEAEAVYAPVPEFSDVQRHWGKESIEYVTSKGYFNGVELGVFKPDSKMTRAMIVTVLSRIKGGVGDELTYTYTDVDKGAWFAKSVNWAYENGIVEAGETFRPDDDVTRLELMKMLYNFAQKLGSGELAPDAVKPTFVDYDELTDDLSRAAVDFCTANGIVNGYSVGGNRQRLKPEGFATRAEVSAMIQRFVDGVVPSEIDMGDIMGKYSDFITVRGDLNNTYNKLMSGEEVVVSYFGGSVTAGFGSSNADSLSWRGLTYDWLKTNFPNAKLTQNNVAQGGSGSHLGAFRVGYDVIDPKSDLVFVEFAINDYYSGSDSEGTVGMYYESVLRQIRTELPECDIIAVYVTDSGKVQEYGESQMHRTAKAQDDVCAHYGVTSIDVGRAIAREMGGYNSSWSKHFADIVHPLDAGYRVFADAILEYMGEYLCGAPTLSYGETKAHALPESYADEKSESFKLDYVPINSLDIFDSIKGFTLIEDGSFMGNATRSRGYIYPSEDDNEFTFTFEGTDLDIYLEFAGGNYWIEYSVDGGEVVKKYITNTNHPFNFLSGLEQGKHTVTYSYKGETGKGGTSTSRMLGAFMISSQG